MCGGNAQAMRKIGKGNEMKGSVQLVQKVATGSVDDAGNTVNPMLS